MQPVLRRKPLTADTMLSPILDGSTRQWQSRQMTSRAWVCRNGLVMGPILPGHLQCCKTVRYLAIWISITLKVILTRVTFLLRHANSDNLFWTGYFPLTPRIRLYPTGLEGQSPNGRKRVVFKAVFEDADAPSKATAMFSTDCATWINVASVIYGSAAMDELIFDMDSKSKVTSITSPSLRVTLNKK